MSDLYLDEIEKIKYYKEKIINRYLSNGTAANKEKVQEYLDTIDKKLAIFSQAYIKSGSAFNVAAFNEQKQDIYRDLVVLYTVLYKLVKERLTNTEAKVRYLIGSLEEQANRFAFLVDSQAVNVYGKTIFHQNAGFDQQYQNGEVIINLGPLDVASGSYLACLFQCNEIDQKDITFYFNDETKIAAYGYNQAYLTVLGNYTLQTEYHDNAELFVGRQNIKHDNKLSADNGYNLFLNRDKLRVLNLNNNVMLYPLKQKHTYYKIDGRGEISFYVYGASYITIDMIGEATYTNFTNGKINMPQQRQRVVMKTEKGLSFDIDTDGVIYADMAKATTKDGDLCIVNDYENITDYTIETICYGENVHFDNVQVVISDAAQTLYDIEYIVIRQTKISELEDQT